jgi:hypothetical protein
MFEACYGSPKAVYTPTQNKKESSKEQANKAKDSLTQKEKI